MVPVVTIIRGITPYYYYYYYYYYYDHRYFYITADLV